jgi:N-acetylglutamate synthase-like GNAT family acetyltransferase
VGVCKIQTLAINGEAMKIRKADISDAETISDLIVPLTKKFVLVSCEKQVHDLLVGSMSITSIEGYLTEGYSYHVAEAFSGEVAGVVGVRNNSHLYHLFVKEKFEGKGISRQLWEIAKAECIANGNKGEFTVNSAVNAEGVYLKFGFKRVDGIRNRNGMVDIPMTL